MIMGTTPIYAIPYVEPTGKLAEYPAADKAQADRVEAVIGALPPAPYRTAAGVSTISASCPANTGQSLAITYPAGRFTQIPIAIGSGESNGYGFGGAASSTTAGCTLRYYNPTASVHSNPKVNWVAVQMLSSAGPGLFAETTGGAIVTCHTGDCANTGIPIELQLTELDANGVTQQITHVVCGVCSQPITDIKR